MPSIRWTRRYVSYRVADGSFSSLWSWEHQETVTETRKTRASETSKGRPDETEYVLQSWPKVGTHVHDDVRGYSWILVDTASIGVGDEKERVDEGKSMIE